jgi:hypothetical protein
MSLNCKTEIRSVKINRRQLLNSKKANKKGLIMQTTDSS